MRDSIGVTPIRELRKRTQIVADRTGWLGHIGFGWYFAAVWQGVADFGRWGEFLGAECAAGLCFSRSREARRGFGLDLGLQNGIGWLHRPAADRGGRVQLDPARHSCAPREGWNGFWGCTMEMGPTGAPISAVESSVTRRVRAGGGWGGEVVDMKETLGLLGL